jgi:hypothetical protein
LVLPAERSYTSCPEAVSELTRGSRVSKKTRVPPSEMPPNTASYGPSKLFDPYETNFVVPLERS